jgi:hypothetical protein
MSQLVDTVKKLRKLRQHIENVPNYDNSKLHPFAFSAECLQYELECYVLEGAINDSILNYGTIKFSYLFKIHHWIFMQKSILVK